jgi:hypothetical protein
VGARVTMLGFGETMTEKTEGVLRIGSSRISRAVPDAMQVVLSSEGSTEGWSEGSHSYHGDSGGPVFLVDGRGRARLVAVMSFGHPEEGYSVVASTSQSSSLTVFFDFVVLHHVKICGINDVSCKEIRLPASR